MRIPLFDIDGTLLPGGNQAHQMAFQKAMRKVFYIETASGEFSRPGKIDRQIIFEVAQEHDIYEEKIKAGLDAAIHTLEKSFCEYERLVNPRFFEPFPGVRRLLKLIGRERQIGLLTGNARIIALVKVERAGLADLFSFGAFGSQAWRRKELVRIAAGDYRVTFGALAAADPEFVIVGDTPLDIACAKENGLLSVGVAMGNYNIQTLIDAGADAVISSFEEPEALLELLDVGG